MQRAHPSLRTLAVVAAACGLIGSGCASAPARQQPSSEERAKRPPPTRHVADEQDEQAPRARPDGARLEQLLRRLPAPRGVAGFALTELERALAYWRGIHGALSALPGRALLRTYRARATALGMRDLSAGAVRDLLEGAAIAFDRPVAVLGGRQPVALFHVRDAAVFRRACRAALGRSAPRPPAWTKRHDREGRSRYALSIPGSASALVECFFDRGGLTVCAPGSLAPHAALLRASGGADRRNSVWAEQLTPGQRDDLTVGRTPKAVVWVNGSVAAMAGVLALADDAVRAQLVVHGPRSAMLLGGGVGSEAGALYARYRATEGEQLYLRLSRMSLTRLASVPLTRGWPSGELLLIPVVGCRVPSLLVGSVDAAALRRAMAMLPVFVRTMGRGIRARQRGIGGRAVVRLSGLSRVSAGLPDVVGLAATASGLLVGPWRCVRASLRAAARPIDASKPSAGKAPRVPGKAPRVAGEASPVLGSAPFLAGKLWLGDPLMAVLPSIRRVAGGKLSPGIPQMIGVVRMLLAQLEAARLSVSGDGHALRIALELRTRHRGPGDDAARALWHRAVAARSAGRKVAFKRLMARMQAEHGGARYAAASARQPVIFGFVGGALVSVAVPSFVKYVRKAKTAEATESLDRIKAGAEASYRVDRHDARGRPLPRRFPATVGWTPRKPCCRQPGHECQPDAEAWNHPVWRALSFRLSASHYYQYRFRSKGSGKRARYTIEARGDLDCDGEYSSYKMLGGVDSEGSPTSKGPIISREIE